MTRTLGWLGLALLATGVAGYALVSLLAPGARSGFVQELFTVRPTAISLHLAGGAIAIVLGALQVNATLRRTRTSLHRLLGKIYIASVLLSGLAGLYLAVYSSGDLAAHFGFGMMAVVWMGTAVAAYMSIRKRDIAAHRAWMLRSYAVTLAALTLRIYLPLSFALGIPFDSSYPAISWLCWVPNLLIVEWFVITRKSRVPT